MPATNGLVGESLHLVPDSRRGGVSASGPRGEPTIARNVIPDGTEWTVALIVLGALGFLVLLEVGGFKTVLAASISTR